MNLNTIFPAVIALGAFALPVNPLLAADAQPKTTAADTATVPAAPAAAATAPAGSKEAQVAEIFPKINTKWQKWPLGQMAEKGAKYGWKPLAADSVRIVGLSGAYEVDLATGKVTQWGGPTQGTDGKATKTFTLPKMELADLIKLLESKEFRDLSTENTQGLDGWTMLVESDLGGNYQWRLYWGGQFPKVLDDIAALVSNAAARK